MNSTTAFALIALLLFLKMFFTTLLQARLRLKSHAFARPEDADYRGGSAEDAPGAVLAQAALRNDLENIPWFLVAHGLLLALGGSTAFALVLGALFVVARVVHTWAYVHPHQPLRNRAYLLGLTTTLVAFGTVAVFTVEALFAQ